MTEHPSLPDTENPAQGQTHIADEKESVNKHSLAMDIISLACQNFYNYLHTSKTQKQQRGLVVK